MNQLVRMGPSTLPVTTLDQLAAIPLEFDSESAWLIKPVPAVGKVA